MTDGGEAASSLGRIAFKTTKYIARGECSMALSGVCETVALGCSTITVISFRGKIYLYVKIVSRGCMSYRNLCTDEGC